MLAYIYTHDCNCKKKKKKKKKKTLRGVGDYSKKFIAAEKCIVVSVKFMERFEKKY